MPSSSTSRRRFLATLGLGAAASLTYPGFIIPRKKEKLGVALVGLGYYSTDLLAPALQHTQHCELKGIVTGSPEKIPVWQEKYGIADRNVYNYENLHTVADNDEIDIIYVVLPTGLHAQYSIIAANAGKHVWCEKPMALTATDCQSIIDAAAKNKVQLTVGYRMHHEPNTQKIMRWAKELPLGKIQRIEAAAAYRDGRTNHWKFTKKLGGGAMYDMGVYPLNGIRYAAGAEPITVVQAKQSTTRPEIFSEVDETTEFTLEFANGIIAKGMTSLGQPANKLHVDTATGWYELEPFSSYSGIKGQASDGTLFDASIPIQQAKQMDDDALAIKEKTAPLVPGEEGLRDIRIVEAIYKAAATGQSIALD